MKDLCFELIVLIEDETVDRVKSIGLMNDLMFRQELIEVIE